MIVVVIMDHMRAAADDSLTVSTAIAFGLGFTHHIARRLLQAIHTLTGKESLHSGREDGSNSAERIILQLNLGQQ